MEKKSTPIIIIARGSWYQLFSFNPTLTTMTERQEWMISVKDAISESILGTTRGGKEINPSFCEIKTQTSSLSTFCNFSYFQNYDVRPSVNISLRYTFTAARPCWRGCGLYHQPPWANDELLPSQRWTQENIGSIYGQLPPTAGSPVICTFLALLPEGYWLPDESWACVRGLNNSLYLYKIKQNLTTVGYEHLRQQRKINKYYLYS